jgi:RHS repeat-associated protein
VTGDPNAGVLYYVSDELGTSRVITRNTGALCYDADFYPYGGERPYTNNCPQNYKFEGKERDQETGNDDFGARYYSNRYGRWLSADWSATPVAVPYATLANPQTLNLYAMVDDDPETSADLDGHCGQGKPIYIPCGPDNPAPCTKDCQNGGTPTPSKTSAAGQFVKNEAIGIAKELANTLISTTNLVDDGINALLGTNLQTQEFTASNTGEQAAMKGTGLAMMLVPGGEEAQGAEVLTRFGKEVESAEKLATQAAAAEKNADIGIHGVSVTARPNPRTPGSSALRSDVEKGFNVYNTGKDIYHRTVELAKPVTQAVADAFNKTFGRTP